MSGAKHLRITSKYFCAGVGFDDADRVVVCAPILAYMQGWPRSRVEEYARIRHWQCDLIDKG
jgi:hypothetical protein